MMSIECVPCGEKILRRYPRLELNGGPALLRSADLDGPAEEGRLVRGELALACQCDSCARGLPRGSSAIAFTAWIVGREIGSWEPRYFVSTGSKVPAS